MSDPRRLQAVADALAADGFEFSHTGSGAVFLGRTQVGSAVVELSLTYRDRDFSSPPRVKILNPEVLPGHVLPHLDEEGVLCVVDSRRYVADRYNAAAQARGVVVRARSVLGEGLTRHAQGEIEREFPAMWGGATFGVAFDKYEGPIVGGQNAGGFLVFRRPETKKDKPTGYAFAVSKPLSFLTGQTRPETIGECLTWAKSQDPALAARLLERLDADGASAGKDYVITAPNGAVGFRMKHPTVAKAIVQSFQRPGAWKRFLMNVGKNLRIERQQGTRADLEYALSRNGDGTPPLAGRSVLVVGCGAIGGFLARALAQLGAGSGGGELVLADDERLAAWNVGRHLLGMDAVGLNKAEACKSKLETDFPGPTFRARPMAIQASPSLFVRADICIDATGEEAVSEMLSEWQLRGEADGSPVPALIHAWVEGEGAAVFSFLSSDRDFGCFRCLHPVHEEPRRFSALHGDAPELQGGCGEGAFMPYGPAAPMTAAALAAQHCVDWSAGKSRPLLRCIRLDLHSTKEVKPANPRASTRCPACSRPR